MTICRYIDMMTLNGFIGKCVSVLIFAYYGDLHFLYIDMNFYIEFEDT